MVHYEKNGTYQPQYLLIRPTEATSSVLLVRYCLFPADVIRTTRKSFFEFELKSTEEILHIQIFHC